MTTYNLCTTRPWRSKNGKVFKQWGIIKSFQDKELAEKELSSMVLSYPDRDFRIDELPPGTHYFPGLGEFCPQPTPD